MECASQPRQKRTVRLKPSLDSPSAHPLGLLAALARLEHEGGALAGAQGELAGHAVTHPLERCLASQEHGQTRCVEGGAVLVQLHLVAIAGVVEPGLALEPEVHLAAHSHHPAHQPPLVLGVAPDGHEVLHLTDPVGGQETGDQDVGVGQIELLGRVPVVHRARSSSGRPCRRPGSTPNTLGESNHGQHNQSMVPLVPTSATVCRSPMTPCSAIGR